METLRASVIQTRCGKRFDLSRALPFARNAATPYGLHNFAVYRANGSYYIKGYNTGNSETMLDAFELISENEAFQYLNKR
ncbi:hypothetical protein [Adhaeribacter aquaticus]|uniref:hypothetical protein n=1 Tax=Adhaeribacter aquaticus TaxID=299567 RepID=UPI000416F9EC|nr:hypothetical protein [Adhaeribacter aquaticus]